MRLYFGLALTLALLTACGSVTPPAAAPADPAFPADSGSETTVGTLAATSKNKLSSSLNLLLSTPDSERFTPQAALPALTRSPFGAGRPGSVTIDALASGDPQQLLARLQALGLQHGEVYGRVVSGRLPVAALSQVAQLSELQFARQALAVRSQAGTSVSGASAEAYPKTGLTVSQGVKAMRADVAARQFGVRGRGVEVGVLSDSFNNFDAANLDKPLTTPAQDIKNNDLPRQGVEVLDEAQRKGADEGRAMMQIVHDVAPAADLSFASAFNGEASFANNIGRLADAGANVIVDDVGYLDEPMFQDGIVAQAVDKVARRGVAYFSAAGNAGRQSYESSFYGSTRTYRGGELHDFARGKPTDTLQKITVEPGDSILIVLQWDDPFASASLNGQGARSDLDLYVLDERGRFIPPNPDAGQYTVSADHNIGADPVEIVQYINHGSKPQAVHLAITKVAGPAPRYLKWVNSAGGSAPEYDTQSPTAYGHPNAAGAAGVGASYYKRTPAFDQNPPLLNSFSSVGGVPILFDLNGKPINELRHQPRFTAPNGVDTSFFYPGTSDVDKTGFPNFFGTSAAAPHAAGVAALMLEKRPKLNPWDVYSAMAQGAIDMNTPGYDFASGAGLIQADKAVANVLK